MMEPHCQLQHLNQSTIMRAIIKSSEQAWLGLAPSFVRYNNTLGDSVLLQRTNDGVRESVSTQFFCSR